MPPQFVGGPTYPFTGYTIRFTEKKLKQLYPTHDEYVEKVKTAAEAAREAGVIPPYRVEEYVQAAEAAPIPELHRPNLNKQRLP